jgi:hypothetical protein
MLKSDDARARAIEKALEAYNNNPIKRTEEIEFRGVRTLLHVVTLTLDVPLLNHNNARLAAQLIDHPSHDEIFADPTSIESQTVLESLLRKTAQFDALKDQLTDLKQQKPGLITRAGLLVNGNTRLSALRAIGAAGIDVAVLPIDASHSDLIEIEMAMQMTRLVHQDYTFTNELLFMRRYLKDGKTVDQLATKMGWLRRGRKKVEQRLRILAIIEEVRKLSKTHLPYQVFDSKEEHLKNLDDEYENLKNAGEIARADRTKWSRVAAILMGVNKDQVRTIDSDFFEDVALKRLGDKPEALALLDRARRVDVDKGASVIDELLGKQVKESEQLDMRLVVEEMLNLPANRSGEGDLVKELEGPFAILAEGARGAADQIIRDERRKSFLIQPASVLRDMCLDVQGVIEKFAELRLQRDFDEENFNFELQKLNDAVSELSKLASPKKPK